jgi:hypothetical protein
MNES